MLFLKTLSNNWVFFFTLVTCRLKEELEGSENEILKTLCRTTKLNKETNHENHEVLPVKGMFCEN